MNCDLFEPSSSLWWLNRLLIYINPHGLAVQMPSTQWTSILMSFVLYEIIHMADVNCFLLQTVLTIHMPCISCIYRYIYTFIYFLVCWTWHEYAVHDMMYVPVCAISICLLSAVCFHAVLFCVALLAIICYMPLLLKAYLPHAALSYLWFTLPTVMI